MPRPRVTVRIDLSKLNRVARGLADEDRGPIADMFRKWSYRMFGFLQARFVRFSRGGGNWPPLSPMTRRARGDIMNAAILRDTNRLFGSLSPSGSPAGKLDQRIPHGIRIGIGGPASYPEGNVTLGDVASFHQLGQGVPKREIIVQPDASTRAGMIKDADDAIQDLVDGK